MSVLFIKFKPKESDIGKPRDSFLQGKRASVRHVKHNGSNTKGGLKMEYAKLDKKKGVAGLNVYLSLIAMLFMIGIIVMVFQIAGSKLMDSTTDADAIASINETKQSLAESTGFFGTFIVLGAMVVLILLVVIIINSIRATGITEGA